MTKTSKIISMYRRQKVKNVSAIARKFEIKRQTVQKYLQLAREKGKL